MMSPLRIGSVPLRGLHAACGLLAAGTYILLLFFLPNWSALSLIFTSALPWVEKFTGVYALLEGAEGELGKVGTYLTGIVVILLFVNATLFAAFIEVRFFLPGRGIVSSALAFVASVMGLGCVTCGALVGTMLIGLFGSASAALLSSFTVALNATAAVLFVLSIVILVRRMREPAVC